MNNPAIKRRSFLQLMAGAGLASGVPALALGSRAAQADEVSPYSGDFYISIDAEGGWDVTSFCDPKQNPAINHWADSGTTQTISGSPIQYAPFAHNSRFFNKHYSDMLVINGVDAQTNAHQAGRRYNWSGRLAEGYPSFAALAAAVYGKDLPLAYLSNGGYNQTADLVSYTLMQDPSALNKLVYPDRFVDYDPTQDDLAKYYHRKSTRDLIASYQQQRLSRLQAAAQQSTLAPRLRNAINQFANAKQGESLLARLEAHIPETLVGYTDDDGEWNPLLRQAQIAIAAYKSGLCVSCDLVSWGFDTHADHDAEQGSAMRRLQNGIEFLWAEAERQGIADKLRVLVSSDFGRTPAYNEGDGKDHWPIGSALFMAKNASWANRVVGATSLDHQAQNLNPQTLQLDSSEAGIRVQPKHIQYALRKLAGIENHEICQRFPLQAEDFDFFNPALNT